MSNENEWGVGNKKDSKAFAQATVQNDKVDLIWGEYPHSRSDNPMYARFGNGEVVGFDGHRVITKIELEEYNYLKESGLSGDEVRKGGRGRIYFDGIQCYDFFFRDIERALLEARNLVVKLSEHESSWAVQSQRVRLIGRKVYWREQPAIVRSLIEDQGCLILEPDGEATFKAPVYWDDAERDAYVKVDVLDPHVWWFRDQ